MKLKSFSVSKYFPSKIFPKLNRTLASSGLEKLSKPIFEVDNKSTAIFSISIKDELRNKLKNTFSKNLSHYTLREQHLLFSYQKTVSELPSDIIGLVRDFKNCPNMSPVMLLRNLPIDDDLPNTPCYGKYASNKMSFVSESCLTGFSQLLGEIYCHADELGGNLIHNVCPEKGLEVSNTGGGSEKQLNFHIENAYFRFRPDYLALFCLRNDHEKHALTTLIDARDMIKKLTDEDIEILRQPLFSMRTPESFEKEYGKILWSEPRPIISGPSSSPEIIMRPSFEMKTLSQNATRVLATINKKILDSNIPSHNIKLEPGDLVIINNRRAIHGRSRFTPRYDGQDRWLQRVYVTKDLWSARIDEQQDYRIIIKKE
ncbi:hypothetical protein Glove_13g167 [Diversispora epigaea]|uniref:TauD/TfdA-like domain-containing protein n=1 Tax=Diversispora epigaea TaxID=1348612 RepID=A0A397JW44_9GLOM|nr:hypothetical protein Glove_13g167 [Diversispora epigaea]